MAMISEYVPTSFNDPIDLGISNPSSFAPLKIKRYIGDILSFVENTEKIQFRNFITKRMDYLKNLKMLPENWIDGNSKKPKEKSIINAIILLHTIETYIIGQEIYSEVTIIMSPTPDGYISMQLMHKSNSLFITIENEELEFEICKHNYFVDMKPTNTNNSKAILEKLDLFVNG